eukprot:6804034-Prymnesium_polylepis.1
MCIRDRSSTGQPTAVVELKPGWAILPGQNATKAYVPVCGRNRRGVRGTPGGRDQGDALLLKT